MNQQRLLEEMHGEIIAKNHEKLKQLLSLADLNVINDKRSCDSMLDLAIRMDDHVSVEILLAHGAIPNYNETHHIWPTSTFSRAILSGNLKIIQLLINQGCDPETLLKITDQQDVISATIPYDYWYKIVELDNISIFQYLLSCKDCKISNDDKWSQKILLLACGSGSARIVEYLLNQGVSVESADEKNWTCIFYAVAFGQISVIDLLLTWGANLKSRDFKGRTLLHISVFYHELASSNIDHPIAVVRLLIGKGADINATDNEGLTPINAAFTVKKINDYIISLLLHQRDIDLSITDIHGTTFLHRVISTGYNTRSASYHTYGKIGMRIDNYHDLLLYLVGRFDLDINARDKEGRMPLQFLERLEHLNQLLELGADTKFLKNNNKVKCRWFTEMLSLYKIKRSLADLSDDQNIDALFAQLSVCFEAIRANYSQSSLEYSKEIQQMKETILCDKLTYYDFLHAKKRTCIKIAKKPGIREILMERKHGLSYYGLMLAKNYLNGARPLTPIESEAIDSVEKNLDVVFNNKLPNLVVYNIKKYIDIEDMITLQNINHVAV